MFLETTLSNIYQKRIFISIRIKGSHFILKSIDKTKTIPIPRHTELDRGTLRNILLLANIDIDEFIDEWNN